jgi:hypothetical protein
MFKHIYHASILLFISLPIFGMSTTDNYITNLTSQLTHINGQIKAVKRAWNEARIVIAKAEKALLNRSAALGQIFTKIITSNAFTTPMNASVDQQFEAIVNNYSSFSKVTYNLSDFYSGPMNNIGQRLYSAMASKAYYFLLGKKLAQKSKELATTIISLKQQQQQAPSAQYPSE